MCDCRTKDSTAEMSTTCANVAPPPVPLFEDRTQSAFCPDRARESIFITLQAVDLTFSGAPCCTSLAVEHKPRAAKGANKRKGSKPRRSDDGCDTARRQERPAVSTDEAFVKRLKRSCMMDSTAGVRKKCQGVVHDQKRGLSADEAIAASRQRASKRKMSLRQHKFCSVIVSGVVVRLTPVSGRRGTVHHAR